MAGVKLSKSNRILVGLSVALSVTLSGAAYALNLSCSDALQTAAISSESPKIIIVDPYSSARFLAPEYKKLGADVIAVHSRGRLLPYFIDTFIASDFSIVYPHQSLEKTLEFIRSLKNVKAIIPGAEPGVLLADELTHHLGRELNIPDNGINPARRDKFLMQEQIRSHGLRSILQLKSSDVSEVIQWADQHQLWNQGLVLKPNGSGGTDGVFFCYSREQVLEAFRHIRATPNTYGEENTVVLAQERLRGIEYVVNTVSRDGIHKVTDFWEYEKIEPKDGRGAIYSRDILLPSRGAIQAQLRDYAFRVLDALGIQTGWGHAEIMMTSKGPILIEVGARMMGSGQPRIVADATGHSQIDVGVLATWNPKSFFKIPDFYEIKKHAVVVSLMTEGHRTFTEDTIPLITALPSYVRHSFSYKPGETTRRTIDLHTILGQVELAHESQKALEADIAKLRLWEALRLFETSH